MERASESFSRRRRGAVGGVTLEGTTRGLITETGVEEGGTMAWEGMMVLCTEGCQAGVNEKDFLTDPLEGDKAAFILRNSMQFRRHFSKKYSSGELFQVYDRHPACTVLEPRSGVMYFIRTEEGLQDKSISLKSVAPGPGAKYTWKMAWGRKTHLKKSGILYKSYRCRNIFAPKSTPPPYRMQIYILEEHDMDTSKGERPTPGLALVQILSLEDAPLRKRSGFKRDNSEDDEYMVTAGTPSPLTSDGHGTPHTHTPSTPYTHSMTAAKYHKVSKFSPGVAQRLFQTVDENPPPEQDTARSHATCFGDQDDDPIVVALNGSANDAKQLEILEMTKWQQQVSCSSLPHVADLFKKFYGKLGPAALAGIVSGSPWGLPPKPKYSFPTSKRGESVAPDFTAAGWAELIRACVREEERQELQKTHKDEMEEDADGEDE